MTTQKDKHVDNLLSELRERAKELNCLYEVQGLLNDPDISFEDTFSGIIQVIPSGWQYPEICQTEIVYGSQIYSSQDLIETPWVQTSDIIVQDSVAGKISVSYTEERPEIAEGPFLQEERQLINTIADQIANYILNFRLREIFERETPPEVERLVSWRVVLDLLRRTNPSLLVKVSRKMINNLCWAGVQGADALLLHFSPAFNPDSELLDVNTPFQINQKGDALAASDQVFRLAGKHLDEDEILGNIQLWIREDQSSFLVHVLDKPGSSLIEIKHAVERYHHLVDQGLELSGPRDKSVKAALIRRIVSDQPEFVRKAGPHVKVDDFNELLDHIISPMNSHGKLGGKGAGIFLATQILKTQAREDELLRDIKTPKTWYLSSDAIFSSIGYNELEDFVEHKYIDITQVRQEYPYVVHVFKNAPMPPEIHKELSLALDDFGDVPLIVRSSSLLEDQVGMSFAGKYKSLFIANRGSKPERLEALVDAIMEVYASMFGPDPIEYRLEHGLIDHHEEMGILIQEVVGTRVGPYYFPAYAGVAFSQNEFRWSSRIRRRDGLIRMVPGLGTRAVDRLSDDFPVLVSPGQPGLRVNVSMDEIVRYSPKMMDVINLENGTFESVEIHSLLKQFGRQYPEIKKLVSIITQNSVHEPLGFSIDFEKENTIISFEGLFRNTPFLKQVRALLSLLQEHFNHPVDIEFACDGKDFYLLQCRSQSHSQDQKPAVIPRDIPPESTLFTAKRYISNGVIQNIHYIVYVDPLQYGKLGSRHDMLAVGRAVGRLNNFLPRHQFILMGPGRWGSRGDIKLGVNVTYSDINNTTALIEIALKHGDYVPELSFGTHFFQDLVEASIRYLPIYPDDFGIIFNKPFIESSQNLLSEYLPDFAHLSDVLRVIDVRQAASGKSLQILMNADQSEAIGYFATEVEEIHLLESGDQPGLIKSKPQDDHWGWRLQAVETIATHLDPERFGVKGLYLMGSTKNATAGPKSDIDLLVHIQGTGESRLALETWLEAWSLSLDESNFQRTGYKSDGLLDIHYITDEDIQKQTSYAVRIGAVNDPARPLKMGGALKTEDLK